MMDKIKNRKILYVILSIILISIFTLTIAYAVLTVTLNISGSAEIAASNWNIHFENINVTTGSSGSIPIIKDNTTVNFSTTLNMPGDYYIFTVDVVNNGTIDAMIDSITKTPTLTADQAKYINYVIEYENGDTISAKQLVESGEYVRIKVKVQYRKDITTSDIPTSQTTLNLSFKVNYIQAAETDTTTVTDNGTYALKVVSGDLNTPGSEICIGEECFYLINNDGITVSMLAKYNLMVGNKVTGLDTMTGVSEYEKLETETGIQDASALGAVVNGMDAIFPFYGTFGFSTTTYWLESVTVYPQYVYNSNSEIYQYVESYKSYLETAGVDINAARLISIDELDSLKCNHSTKTCELAPSWVYSTSYWTGTADENNGIWYVVTNAYFNAFAGGYSMENMPIAGIRPVIDIPLSEF